MPRWAVWTVGAIGAEALSSPMQPVRMQQDTARGDQTLAGAAEALVRPVCVVAVPGVGPVVSWNSH